MDLGWSYMPQIFSDGSHFFVLHVGRFTLPTSLVTHSVFSHTHFIIQLFCLIFNFRSWVFNIQRYFLILWLLIQYYNRPFYFLLFSSAPDGHVLHISLVEYKVRVPNNILNSGYQFLNYYLMLYLCELL